MVAHKFPARTKTAITRLVRYEALFEQQAELKTLAMIRLEIKYNKPIQVLLTEGNGVEVAKKLNITSSGVCRWRKKLGMRVLYGRGASA